VTNDPLLFERAARVHDLGVLRPLHEQRAGKSRLDGFAALQFRMVVTRARPENKPGQA
jgi:hypothetical protein